MFCRARALLLHLYVCFTHMCVQCVCSIHMIVTCCGNKLIMHIKNMTSEIYVLSSEKWKKKKKSASHFLKNNICQKTQSREEWSDGLSWGRETVSVEATFPSVHGCHGSILPPYFCVFYRFPTFRIETFTWSITHWRLYGIRVRIH